MRLPFARKTDPVTSHEAAATITAPELKSRTEMVYSLLWVAMTDEQLVNAFNAAANAGFCKPASPQGIRSARANLVKDGRIIAIENEFGTTSMGNRCHIWKRVA